MRRFLETVIWCSEKAAGLARACRREKDLFQLLVEVNLNLKESNDDFYINFLIKRYSGDYHRFGV